MNLAIAIAAAAVLAVAAKSEPTLDGRSFGEYGALVALSSSTEVLVIGGQAATAPGESGDPRAGLGWVYSLFDVRPPRTRLTVGDDDPSLAGAATPLTLTAVDDLLIPGDRLGSGVHETYYSVDGGAYALYAGTFTLTGDGLRVLRWFSRDRAGNAEEPRSREVIVDAVFPRASLASPCARPGLCAVVSGRLTVFGTASDTRLRRYRIEAAPGEDASSGFSLLAEANEPVEDAALAEWDLSQLGGWHTLRLTVEDAAGNVSTARLTLHVGQPARTLVLGAHDWFNMPEGVAVGGDGAVYVADTNNDRIAVFSADGSSVASFGAGQLKKPRGLALDAGGRLWIADSHNDRILQTSATGALVLQAGGFKRPAGVAAAGGKIYVADSGNERIVVLDEAGAQLAVLPLPGAEAAAVAADETGNVYVADAGGRVLKLRPDGAVSLQFALEGSGKDGKARPARPAGLAVSRDGECIVVSDRRGGRVLKLDRRGSVTLAFGTHGKLKDHQPPPSAIVFNRPMGVAFGPDGALYIADRNNNRIQAFSTPGAAPVVAPPPARGDDVAQEVVERETGGVVERGDGAGVAVPPGAVAEDMMVSVSSAVADRHEESQREKQREEKGLKAAYAPIQYGPEGASFETPVTLVIPYSESLVAAQAVAEDTLKIHYWNPRSADWEELESKVDKQAKTVSAKTSHFSLYQVHGSTGGAGAAAAPAAAADATFMLREVYAYPNPARAGAKPVIHVAVGWADSLTIRVFDVTGRQVRQVTLDGAPSVVDGRYAYEHVWDGHIASGLYFFTIEAKKHGHSTITKGGKLAVVR